MDKSIKYLCCFLLLFTGACKKETSLSLVEKISFNTKKNCYHLSFLDENIGFLSGGSRYDFGFLAKTTDGGKTWSNPDSVAGSASYANWFFSPAEGYISAFNNEILYTQNAGASFTKYNSSLWEPPRQIQFFNRQHGAVTFANGYGSGGCLTTHDGGNSWHEKRISNTAPYALQMLDSTTILLFGYGMILKSTDGGDSFQIKKLQGDFYRAAHFFDAQNGLVVGYQGEIIQTKDGGESWSVLKKTNNPFSSREHFLAVHFNRFQLGFAVGENGLIYYSKDSGNSWHKISEFTNSALNTVFVKDDNSAIVAGDNGEVFLIKL